MSGLPRLAGVPSNPVAGDVYVWVTLINRGLFVELVAIAVDGIRVATQKPKPTSKLSGAWFPTSAIEV